MLGRAIQAVSSDSDSSGPAKVRADFYVFLNRRFTAPPPELLQVA